jgi:radical S-adenosyl methionine domain-containing protein 2
LNFVGGEPALLGPLPELVSFSRRLGVRTSFVSNGLMLRRFSPRWISMDFDIAGFSIDSSSETTNQKIGRSTRSGVTLDLDDVCSKIHELKSLGTWIKVNTVVSAANHAEDLTGVIRLLQPDKWKIFQTLPVYGDRDSVTTEEFSSFIARHIEFENIISTEDNDQMTGSYAMIDPLGRFFWYDGDSTTGYRFSSPILDIGAEKAFSECVIFWDRYISRYELWQAVT